MNLPGTTGIWMGEFVRHDFDVGGHRATVIVPPRPLPGVRWAWKGEFLDAFPGTEIALLRRGMYVVHIGFSDQFGSPAAVRVWDALYDLLTGIHGFAPKPALIGLSRGGLYCYQWAAVHPDRVACLYGDAPVCDMRSWPGGRGKGPGSARDWELMKQAFGFASDAEALAFGGNPVDNLKPLADAGIPILHVYGEADEVVPWEENTGVVASRYRAFGGSIGLIAKPGCGHHPHGLENPTPVVDFMLRHTAGTNA